MRTKKLASTNKRERGSVLATASLGMLSLLLAVGLGVDISRFYLVKNELQNAADAAALAAVSALNGNDGGIDNAVARAELELNKFDFNKMGVTIDTIEFSQTLDSGYVPAMGAKGAGIVEKIRFARVTTAQSPVGVSFAQMLLGSSKNLTATATAGYSVPLNEICNFLPISVIDYGVPMSPGNTYTFRASASDGPSPGNYQLLAILAAGADDVRVGLAAGVDACAAPGAEYAVDTKPGVSAGAVRQGLNTRFDEYQTSAVNPQDMPPDKNILENIDYDTYTDANGPKKTPSHTGFDKRRVVYIPIIKLEEYDQGRNVVKFNRFGQFFLKTKVGSGSGGELIAEYIDDITLGIGRYNPAAGPGEEMIATPVLYK